MEPIEETTIRIGDYDISFQVGMVTITPLDYHASPLILSDDNLIAFIKRLSLDVLVPMFGKD